MTHTATVMRKFGTPCPVLFIVLILTFLLPAGYANSADHGITENKVMDETDHKIQNDINSATLPTTSIATFAGGCFWCMEKPFDVLDGVISTTSGYTGGHIPSPSYEQVSAGNSGHVEAIQIEYNPQIISYEKLLNIFWMQIDPTDNNGQFVDRGKQYRSAIFYHSDAQKQLAITSRDKLQESGLFDKPIVTEIIKAEQFYKAEDYHQDYYQKNPLRYHYYRYRSGRDQFLEKIWKDGATLDQGKSKTKYTRPSEEAIKDKLSDLQYEVTQREGTEAPFKNEYWDNKQQGIYVDIVSGEPLFSSLDKFKSGTGWPSFTKPIDPDFIVTKTDKRLFITRTEVRSHYADSHLGHVFKDGPAPTGLRYCINSAALKFIPVEDMEQSGYADYLPEFKTQDINNKGM